MAAAATNERCKELTEWRDVDRRIVGATEHVIQHLPQRRAFRYTHVNGCRRWCVDSDADRAHVLIPDKAHAPVVVDGWIPLWHDVAVVFGESTLHVVLALHMGVALAHVLR